MMRSFLLALLFMVKTACVRPPETQEPNNQTRPAPTYGQYDEARRTDALDGVPIRWSEIHSEHEFWQLLYANPRTVVLFGTRGCAPCDNAKVWWQTHGAPPGWSFGFWESEDYETGDERFREIVPMLAPEGGRFPVAAVFRGAAPGRAIHEVESAHFLDYTGVTLELKRWLVIH